MESNEAVGVSQLRLKYPGDEALLFRDLTFSVRKGEKVLLLGPSGCGKSTLLQVLSGIIPGTVEIPMKAESIRLPSRPGYVFQDPDTQFCMPYVDEEIAFVLENLQIPREEMPGLIRRYLIMAGLHFEDVHTPISQLSQGMKQRLAIAGMLALQPDVWFLDEPTALLDEEGTLQVWETIQEVAVGKTLLIVEHKISGILHFVDRVVIFAPDGHLIADGNPQEVFSKHKQELIDYGIWYPDSWEDYDSRVIADRSVYEVPSDCKETVLNMNQFQGLRGGDVTVHVDNLSVHAGEWIMVVGPNGAGKSSLLLAIMRLIRTNGTCRVEGVTGTKVKVEDMTQQVAFVFQNPEFQFVTDSVEEEIAYSMPDDSLQREEWKEAVNARLHQYELEPLRHRHPFQLSMGQKRRLSVASAMVRDQRILLLDEPTFGLDASNTWMMLERLERMSREGTAILMVTHDPEIVKRFATRVWQVQEGRVIDAGKEGNPHASDVPSP